MKSRSDVVDGWLRKAESDIIAMEASLNADALDAACFHAQQASEKALKAFLIHSGIEPPMTHNLVKLLETCETKDPAFKDLLEVVRPLTPYAVEMRYDTDFWPDQTVASDARDRAVRVREFVLERISR